MNHNTKRTIAVLFILIIIQITLSSQSQSSETYPGGLKLKNDNFDAITLDAGTYYQNGIWTVHSPSELALLDGLGNVTLRLTGSRLFADRNPTMDMFANVTSGQSKSMIHLINNAPDGTDRWDIALSKAEFGTDLDFNYNNNLAGYIAVDGFHNSSDRRLKTNITDLNSILSKVLLLKPSLYERKATLGKQEYGYIAQELEEIFPEVVSLRTTENGNQYMVNYSQMIPINTRAIQEQQEIINQQAELIQSLGKRIAALESKAE